MITRREIVGRLVATGALTAATWAEAGNPAFLSAGMRFDGTHALCGLDGKGQITFELPLPARGHAAAAHPTLAEAVAFARRPGRFALVIDCLAGREKARLDAPPDRHFYGHGTFSADGDLLFTTENDFEAARGVVGVWDFRNGCERIGEFSSGGVGPHDIRLMPGGKTLVIANGGIETHPDTGRTKLNLPSMRPNLSYLSLDGQLEEQLELDSTLHRNSIRHLAVARNGTVAFAMQWQGDMSDAPPLLALHRRGEFLSYLMAGEADHRSMQGYAGSVALSGGGNQAAITSPRGSVVLVFDLHSGRCDAVHRLADVCGVYADGARFLVTSGTGIVGHIGSGRFSTVRSHPLRWDNHLVAL